MYQWGGGGLVRGRLCTSGGGWLEEDCVPVVEVD